MSAEPFFRSRWVEAPTGVEQLDPAQLAPGFRAGGAHCGLKGGGKTDVGLVVCDAESVSSALLLTRNASAAAPIRVCRERVARERIRAAVVNSGNANAETGGKGYADALAMCDRAAAALSVPAETVAVAETGTIGVPLPIEAVLPGIDEAAGNLAADGGGTFSDAIVTTDRWPKRCTLRAGGVTLSAQAKGAGMIEPKMATMLCFVQTDAVVEDPDALLRDAVDASFNRITVDGQRTGGVVDGHGIALDGKRNGRPGSKFAGTVKFAGHVATTAHPSGPSRSTQAHVHKKGR
jgi:glutamate N-acetyltransferase/amino-acid N-acetyltransferase